MAGHFEENLQTLGRWLARPHGAFAKYFAITAIVLALPLLGLVFAPAILSHFAPPLDTSRDLYTVNRPISFTFVDAEGNQAGHRGAMVGERLKLNEMPAYLPAAFIAVEDRHFYSHGGIDIHGLLRAMWVNFRAGHVVQGGSTITQQTAKIVFLNPKRTYARKVEELFDAASLENSLSKSEILQLYLNRIYLGSGAYGVDGAAHVYFGKSARDLTLPEAAMLATLTTAPSVFSPRRDLGRAQERSANVLDLMVKTRAVTREQAEEAKANPAVITDRSIQDARNFFLDTAADEATRLASVNGEPPSGDLVVHTTLDPRLQENARRSLNRVLAKEGRRARAHEGAVILMKPDGAISALVGGRDYDESVFNRATLAKRQPGSAFKPFVYLAALESGVSPWETRNDSSVDIDGWAPTNYGGRSWGTITLASALAHSVNTVTASLGQEVGIDKVIQAAQRLGIKSPLEANASLSLGTSEVTPLEITAAYGAFANGGMRVQPYMVTQVEDIAGHVLYRRQQPAPERVVSETVNRDMVAMLYGVVSEGTGRSAAISGHEAAGKTGTTQDYRDAWFVGFTTDYVACVWIGNDNSSPMRNVTGGSIPAEVWKAVMTGAEEGLPAKPLDKSQPQTVETDNGIVTAEEGGAAVEDDSEASTDVDEESGGAKVEEEDTEPADGDNSSGDKADGQAGRRARKDSWWNWLFTADGRSKTETSAADGPPARSPPPRPPQSAVRVGPPRETPSQSDSQSLDRDSIGGTRSTRPRYDAPTVRRDEPPPAPPRAGPPPPPPPDVDDEGAQHPDGSDNDSPE